MGALTPNGILASVFAEATTLAFFGARGEGKRPTCHCCVHFTTSGVPKNAGEVNFLLLTLAVFRRLRENTHEPAHR